MTEEPKWTGANLDPSNDNEKGGGLALVGWILRAVIYATGATLVFFFLPGLNVFIGAVVFGLVLAKGRSVGVPSVSTLLASVLVPLALPVCLIAAGAGEGHGGMGFGMVLPFLLPLFLISLIGWAVGTRIFPLADSNK